MYDIIYLMSHYIYLSLFIIFCFVLERFFPRKKFASSSQEIFEGLNWFIVNEVILAILLGKISIYINALIVQHHFSLNINLTQLPHWMSLILYIVILDFFSYWTHRFAHSIPKLWNIHKLHHSIQTFNSLYTFKHSLIWQLYIFVSLGLIGGLFQLNENIKMITPFIFLSFDIIQHANISFNRVPYFLNYIFILPRNHLIHHSQMNYLRYGQNFGLIFSFWDIIFKTYYLPQKLDVCLGLKNNDLPQNFFSRFFYPLIKR